MTKTTKIALFEGKQIRRHWDKTQEKWYFSVVDVVQVLTNQIDFIKARKYWNKLAERLRIEGSEVVTKCHQLKLVAADGKMRLTDVADTEVMLRIIQSIPSPKAEPFKLWLARVGYERIEETHDPEIAINRALKTYLRKGYGKNWINQRLKSIEIRKALTDEWETRGVKNTTEFAILTDDITLAWTGMTTKQYKNLKGLKMENLRDNMTNLELVLNMLAETATTEISTKRKPKTFPENRTVARQGGTIAGSARKQIEAKSGKKVISKLGAKKLKILKK
ncbi:antirepressor [Candidatus Roizmanbacteria bacterium RIFCSPHIGHO2_02_FULL_40_13b]|nr:MAG: antirepressor [Candidatus Roizmanbacteria bacterium RIFCSPHIGHO2_02_FULL_40_13b]OGK57085.1 MAG: antirepressor [Candidatus Roizmanbacteria bacterium RIFCSPLOWO2_02_FULL_39_8]